MPLLTKPLYQRSEGSDEDRWRLAFDTDTHRLFVEHEMTRGDMRGSGYATSIDEIDINEFLRESGPGQHQLARLLEKLFEECHETA
ncbi:MAG: hypothetical protein ABI192_07940 [Bradyrhizobium sp.]